jgi:hypothetical protein
VRKALGERADFILAAGVQRLFKVARLADLLRGLHQYRQGLRDGPGSEVGDAESQQDDE